MYLNEFVALGVFVIVFFLIIERRKFNNIPIWASMLIGAGSMLPIPRGW
jgi:hypothetical protein